MLRYTKFVASNNKLMVINDLGNVHEYMDNLCQYCQDVEVKEISRVCGACAKANKEALKGSRELAVLFHGANVIGGF